jgi:hypothetical protein
VRGAEKSEGCHALGQQEQDLSVGERWLQLGKPMPLLLMLDWRGGPLNTLPLSF